MCQDHTVNKNNNNPSCNFSFKPCVETTVQFTPTFDTKNIKHRSSEVTHCCMEGILDVKEISTSDSCYVESGGTTTHGKWSYGSATITGMYV